MLHIKYFPYFMLFLNYYVKIYNTIIDFGTLLSNSFPKTYIILKLISTIWIAYFITYIIIRVCKQDKQKPWDFNFHLFIKYWRLNIFHIWYIFISNLHWLLIKMLMFFLWIYTFILKYILLQLLNIQHYVQHYKKGKRKIMNFSQLLLEFVSYKKI